MVFEILSRAEQPAFERTPISCERLSDCAENANKNGRADESPHSARESAEEDIQDTPKARSGTIRRGRRVENTATPSKTEKRKRRRHLCTTSFLFRSSLILWGTRSSLCTNGQACAPTVKLIHPANLWNIIQRVPSISKFHNMRRQRERF